MWALGHLMGLGPHKDKEKTLKNSWQPQFPRPAPAWPSSSVGGAAMIASFINRNFQRIDGTKCTTNCLKVQQSFREEFGEIDYTKTFGLSSPRIPTINL